jgi:PKD repeat protein
MHDSAGVNYPVTFSIDVGADGLNVDVFGSVICTGDCSGLTYDWNWGEGVNGSGQTASHTYSSAGTKSIKLTVRNSLGKSVGSATRSVTLTKADVAPTADAVCTWDAGTWTMSVKDNSTDVGDTTPLLKAIVDWDDSSTSIGAPGGTLIHKYYSPGTYTVTLTAIDTVLNADTDTCTAVVADTFSISGTVKTPLGAAPLGGASVIIRKGARVVKVVKTSTAALTLGQFEATSLRPGTYKVQVRKYRYTFAVPGATVTVGPSLFSNASCTAAGSPVECCTGAGTGSCTPPIDISALTGP